MTDDRINNILTWGMKHDGDPLPEPPFKDPADRALAYPERLPEDLMKGLEMAYQDQFDKMKWSIERALKPSTSLLVQRAMLSMLVEGAEACLKRTDAAILAQVGEVKE